jgi:hypothetical protein
MKIPPGGSDGTRRKIRSDPYQMAGRSEMGRTMAAGSTPWTPLDWLPTAWTVLRRLRTTPREEGRLAHQ